MHRKNQALFPAVILFLGLTLNSCSEDSIPVNLSKIEFWNQEKLDRHKNELLKATELEGDVYIGSSVNNLSAFQNIEKIHGQLRIQNTDLENLEGLEHLAEVEALKIDDNNVLETAALPSLVSVAQPINFINNPALKTINLPTLKKVGESPTTGNIGLYGHEELEAASFPEIRDFYSLTISGNPKFKTLQGLTKLENESPYNITLEFSSMESPSSLFKHLTQPSNFEIKVEKQGGNNFEWLGNIATGSIVTIEGSLELEALCPLIHAVDPDKPADVTVLNTATGDYFFGGDLLDACE